MIPGAKKSILFFSAVFMAMTSLGQVRLTAIISDGMILQRDAKVKVWGWSGNNEKLSIKFNGKIYKTTADGKGKWSVLLTPMKAGGPYTMDISASNKMRLKDIWIGDVWLCSGQSNMEYQSGYDDATYEKEMADVNNPQILQFKVPMRPAADGPGEEMSGGAWKTANPKDIGPFTAVGYFFAKNLYEKYHVPIGLINSSVGGTPIEAWISEEGLKGFPDIIHVIQKYKDTAYINSMRRSAGGFPRQQQQSPNDKGLK